jgi:integrase
MNKAKVVIIPEFDLYTPVGNSASTESFLFSPPKYDDCLIKYSASEYGNDDIDEAVSDIFYHFPVIVLPDGGIWKEANRYLLSLLTPNPADNPSADHLNSTADSLMFFINFCYDEGINWLKCSRKVNSPPRKYRRDLDSKVEKGVLAKSTVKKQMRHIVSFYKYLIKTEGVEFSYPLWVDRKSKRPIVGKDSEIVRWKDHMSSDIQYVKGSNNKHTTEEAGLEGHIVDGGYLRPLTVKEQKQLGEALKCLGNVEMKFIHLIGMMTGARKETLLTLRRGNFEYEPAEHEKHVVIYAGNWTKNYLSKLSGNHKYLPNSKNEKPLKIYFPVALYRKIQIYIRSERGLKRLKKAKFPFEDDAQQYVFLSQQGNPFYVSKLDINRGKYRRRPTGGALNVFISSQLKPKLRILGFISHYKFHDTRATYGMNLTRHLIETKKTSNGQVDFTGVFSLVKKRMGHSQFSTTQQYLDFDNNQGIVEAANDTYAKHLSDLLESA